MKNSATNDHDSRPRDLGTLKVGLIGAGKMGMNHLRALRGCAGVEVVGVADPQADPEELRSLLPRGAVLLPTAAELLERHRPDVVHIVTPPATHATLARAALESGAHIYVEKPFTLLRRESEAILAFAAERGRCVCAGHQCLFQHAAKAGHSVLAELGTIVHVESYFAFKTARRSISPAEQAKDILPHAVYMLLGFLRPSNSIADAPATLNALDVGSDGDIRAMVAVGDRRGLLRVTLSGRPVEQYVHLVGTNGSLRVDLISDSIVKLSGPGAGISVLFTPYRQSIQLLTGSTRGLVRTMWGRKYGYPGLRELVQAFIDSIRLHRQPPMTPGSIIETVGLCEEVGAALDAAEAAAERSARRHLEEREQRLPPTVETRGIVLVTGATGFLGRAVVGELRDHGWHVRALARQPPRFSTRVPGVEYRACDLAQEIPRELMAGVSLVVHCAAETRGGKTDHERNSILATRQLCEAAAAARVGRVIHVSSVAVLKPAASSRTSLDEASPMDVNDLERGPYVWGKAQSEQVVFSVGRERGLQVRVLRLAPLVDLEAFEAPGRLGRELGTIYVAVGPKRSRVALCDVATAAAVIRDYAEDFATAPPILNLVEADAPTRAELVTRLRARRPDLRVVWLPIQLLQLANPAVKLLQRLVFRTRHPLDVASAFRSPRYRTELATQVIKKARMASRAAAPKPVAG